jgi:hypothetical protein
MLRAPGPTCAELARQVTTALVVLLDEPPPDDDLMPVEDAPPESPAATPPESTPTPAPHASLAVPDRARPRVGPFEARRADAPPALAGAVFGGAGMTIGTAGSALAWASADLWLLPERAPFAFAAGAFSTFDATESFAPGGVDVRWMGGSARACYVLGDARGLRVLFCGTFAAGALRGAAHDYLVTRVAYRPFLAAGAGGLLRGPLVGRLDWSIDLHALFPFHHETFTIDDAGVVFETKPVGAWVGIALGTRIW